MDYVKRRRQLSRSIKQEKTTIFVQAATLIQRSNDTEYPFNQDRNFHYLSGINDPDCLLMLAPGHPNPDLREVLFIPDFSEFKATWEDAQITIDQAKTVSGIKNVLPNSQRLDIVRQVLGWAERVYTPRAQTKTDLHGMMPTSTEPDLRSWLRRYGAQDFKDLTPEITRLRMVKSAAELNELSECIQMTNQVFEAIEPMLQPGENTRSIAARATYEINKHGFSWGYDPIVAAKHKTCVLHTRENDTEITNGCPVLIDIGAQNKNYYTADVCRSYWIGNPNSEYDQLYDMTKELQEFTMSLLVPGKTMLEVSRSFRTALLERLKLLGLLNKTAELKDTLSFMPHGIGHHLGLDAHDPADYSAPLEPGMVIQVEPGVYLNEKEIGIRLEDAVVITEHGCKILGDS